MKLLLYRQRVRFYGRKQCQVNLSSIQSIVLLKLEWTS